MTHTKGPWSVRMPTEFLNQAAIEPCIGCVYGAGEELQANANLIASAPELLEALNQTVQCLEDVATLKGGWAWEEVVTEARAAISKAKGEV